MRQLDTDSLKQIGQITVNYSVLEFVICSSIWRLLNLSDNDGRIVTSGQNFSSLVTMLDGLYHSKFNSPTIHIFSDRCIGKIKDVSARRNHLIHSTLLFSDDGSFGAFKYKNEGKKGVTKKFQKLTTVDLKKLADDIKSATAELSKLYGQFLKDLHKSAG